MSIRLHSSEEAIYPCPYLTPPLLASDDADPLMLLDYSQTAWKQRALKTIAYLPRCRYVRLLPEGRRCWRTEPVDWRAVAVQVSSMSLSSCDLQTPTPTFSGSPCPAGARTAGISWAARGASCAPFWAGRRPTSCLLTIVRPPVLPVRSSCQWTDSQQLRPQHAARCSPVSVQVTGCNRHRLTVVHKTHTQISTKRSRQHLKNGHKVCNIPGELSGENELCLSVRRQILH